MIHYQSQMMRYELTDEIVRVPNSNVKISELGILNNHTNIKYQQFLNGEIPFNSHVYKDEEERKKKYPINNACGNSGELVINQWVDGRLQGMRGFNMERTLCNHYPKESDGGSDVLGFRLDVKTTYMQYFGTEGQSHLKKWLAVRPHERHEGNIYVLALIGRDKILFLDASTCLPITRVVVDLVGWLRDEELPNYVVWYGDFKGAHIHRAQELHPMVEFPWWELGMPREPIGITMFKNMNVVHKTTDTSPTKIIDKGEW